MTSVFSNSTPSFALSPGFSIKKKKKQKIKKILPTDDEIVKKFAEGETDIEVEDKLREFLKECRNPLAVRSSGLLEDSSHQPLAGIYATHMVPNKRTKLLQKEKKNENDSVIKEKVELKEVNE